MHRMLIARKRQERSLIFAILLAYLGLCLSIAVLAYIVIGRSNSPSILKHGSDTPKDLKHYARRMD